MLLYLYGILTLGISSTAYSFFSIFGSAEAFDYTALGVLAYAIAPYLMLLFLTVFSHFSSNKVNGIALLGTFVLIFGFYYYWSVAGSSSNKPALVFIFVPTCQVAFILFSVILFKFSRAKKKAHKA